MSTAASSAMESSAIETGLSPPPLAGATHARASLPSPPPLLHLPQDLEVDSISSKALSLPFNFIFFFDPTSEAAARLSADLIKLFPSEPSFITPVIEEATHVLLAHPSSTFANDLFRARSPPPTPSSSASSFRPQQLLTLKWVEESIRLKEWQPEENYVYEPVVDKEGTGKEREISTTSSVDESAVPEPGALGKRMPKALQKKETEKPKAKKKFVAVPYTVQETNDLRRFLRESQTIADACEKMVQAHPRRTVGTVRTYYAKNKDEYEDELGTDVNETQQQSWIWTTEEHDLLVKVLAGPVGSLNRGFKAFSDVHPKRSVIAAAKHYQSNRIRLEREIEAYQKNPSSSKLSRKRSPSSSSSSSEMEWGTQQEDEEEAELVQNLPKKRKKPAPSIPYTAEETSDLQKILRESETLKEAAEKMEKMHPRRTAVSIGMYTYRHPETFVHDFKARPPSISWTKQEQDDLVQTFATSTETLLMQCQAVSNIHPQRTPLAISAYYFKHRDRLTPLIDAIKATRPPRPAPPPKPSTATQAQPNFASVLGAIDSLLLQNDPQANQPQPTSPKREPPTAPPSSKRGRLDKSPPPESILLPAANLGLALALPRLGAVVVKPDPEPRPKKEPKLKKEKVVKEKKTKKVKIEVEAPVEVPSPAVGEVASKPGRIILRLPTTSSSNPPNPPNPTPSTSASTSTSSSASSRASPNKVKVSPTRKTRTSTDLVELPSEHSAPEDQSAAGPLAMFSLPKLGMPSLDKASQ